MASMRGANTWNAVSEGLMSLGQSIMGAGDARRQREREEAEAAYRAEQDRVEAERYAAQQERLAAQDARIAGLDEYDRARDLVADQRWAETERARRGEQAQDWRSQGYEVHDITPRITAGQAIGGLQMEQKDPGLPQYMTGEFDPKQSQEYRMAEVLAGIPARQAPREPSWVIRETDQGLVRVNEDTGEVEPLQLAGTTLRGPSDEDGGLLGEYADTLGEIGDSAAPERPRVPGFGGFVERLLPGGRSGYFDEEPAPSLLGKEGLSAQEPAPSPASVSSGAVPDWFRAQHAGLVSQGAPEDVEEAWRQYSGGR